MEVDDFRWITAREVLTIWPWRSLKFAQRILIVANSPATALERTTRSELGGATPKVLSVYGGHGPPVVYHTVAQHLGRQVLLARPRRASPVFQLPQWHLPTLFPRSAVEKDSAALTDVLNLARAAVGAVVAKRAPVCDGLLTLVVCACGVEAVGGGRRPIVTVVVEVDAANRAGARRAVVEARRIAYVAQSSSLVFRVKRDRHEMALMRGCRCILVRQDWFRRTHQQPFRIFVIGFRVCSALSTLQKVIEALLLRGWGAWQRRALR